MPWFQSVFEAGQGSSSWSHFHRVTDGRMFTCLGSVPRSDRELLGDLSILPPLYEERGCMVGEYAGV